MNNSIAAVGPLLGYLDLAGIAVFALSGALAAAAKRQTLVTFLFFAIITGVGGIIRDVLSGEPSILMRPELYVTAAALSAALMVGLLLLGLPSPIAGALAAVAGFVVRGAAIRKGWSLPSYRR